MKRATWVFLFSGVVWLIAALIPVLKGESMKSVFFVLSMSQFAFAVALNARKENGGDQVK